MTGTEFMLMVAGMATGLSICMWIDYNWKQGL